MTANIITTIRPMLSFLVIGLLGRHPSLDALLCVGILGIFALDAIDGYVARKRNETTKIGEMLDTIADRVIENSFWIYFAATGQLPMWIPILVMTRGFLTDALQRTHGYPTDGWRHALTRSRGSRCVWGVSKAVAFFCLAAASGGENQTFDTLSGTLAVVAVGVCLVRGIPFLLPQKNRNV